MNFIHRHHHYHHLQQILLIILVLIQYIVISLSFVTNNNVICNYYDNMSNSHKHQPSQTTTTTTTTTTTCLWYDITDSSSIITNDKGDITLFDGVLNAEQRRQYRLNRLQNHSNILNTFSTVQNNNENANSNNNTTNDDDDDNESSVFLQTKQEDNIQEYDNNKFILGPTFLTDIDQQMSIISDAPSILLESSAGTGKTTVLAGRIAYLIQSKKVRPQNMIILSFTRKDAATLKDKALDILYNNDNKNNNKTNLLQCRQEMEKRLWSGTIHSFAINIIQRHQSNTHSAPLKIISTREMKNRIRRCLGRINSSNREIMLLYKNALNDSNQSIAVLVQHILRCLELWKEAAVLSSPYVRKINFREKVGTVINGNVDINQEHQIPKDDFIELAMRLGIPEHVAELALEISGDYQTLHASMGTCDPSDLATIAYEYLFSNPDSLYGIRSRLHQVILDEYQDVSVSQHKLLQLIINGIDNRNESEDHNDHLLSSKVPILLDKKQVKRQHIHPVSYNVPNFCAAGDSNQSIYGWRGAAPALTVDGFRKDFPQGIVVPLSRSYRLPRNVASAANVLIGHELDIVNSTPNEKSIHVSPAAVKANTLVPEQYLKSPVGDSVDHVFKSSMIVQGLWDMREEAKFIASSIRKRAKARIEISKQLQKNQGQNAGGVLDSSEIAIMVRSSNEFGLILEVLESYGIPYEKISSYDNDHDSKGQYIHVTQKKTIPMKHVKVMTMHQAKGDEFDDVYLANWTEGNFPHPSAVLTNRLHEERRIAYVAITRARQKVIITYSFMTKTAFFGPKGERKDVTEQVLPSRFLDEIKLDSIQDNIIGVEWNDSFGLKETIAGKEVPSCFRKSYKVPNGFHSNKAIKKAISTPQTSNIIKEADDIEHKEEMLETVQKGMQLIFDKKRGACKLYLTIFRDNLVQIGKKRGKALVLRKDARLKNVNDINALINSKKDEITTRSFSTCTARELGLYLVYLLKNGAR